MTPKAPGATALMVKFSELETPPPGSGLNALTRAVPGWARSLSRMAVLSWLLLTAVVARSAPFHRPVEAATKPVPSIVRGNPGHPAGALLSESLMMSGTGLLVSGLMMNAAGAEEPTSGAALTTLTCALPCAATSLARIAAVTWAALTKVVTRAAPFHRA